MTMWVFEDETCIHGIEEDGDYPCAQCADLLQIVDGGKFLCEVGMQKWG